MSKPERLDCSTFKETLQMKFVKLVSVLASLAIVTPAFLATQGCSAKTSTKAKAGGAKGPAAAKTDKQKGGDKATAKKESGTKKGAEVEGVACDAELEGVAWCGSESEVIFCAAGEWYALDCAQVEAGAFCGEDADTNIIDCFAAE
jgi:hypothetical protein